MNSLVNSFRVGFLFLSFLFLFLGIAAVPRLVRRNDPGEWVVVLGTGLLLPAILAALAISRIPLLGPTHAQSANVGAGKPVSFAVVSLIPAVALWLSYLLLSSMDTSDLVKEALIPCALDAVLLTALFSFIRAQTGSSTGADLSGRSSQNRVVFLCNRLDWLLERGERILRPALLQVMGAALVLSAPVIASGRSFDLSPWLRNRWVAAEWGLADCLPVLRPAFDFLGRSSFVVALLLAASTLIFALARTIRPGPGVFNRVSKILACAAAILGACSTMDLYFGWMGLTGGGNASDLWLWSFFALGALVLTGSLAMIATTVVSNTPHRAIVIPCTVMLYATIACTNFLITGAFLSPGDRGFNGLAAFYVGVQFLAWGWIQMAVQHEVNHEEDKLENCPTHSDAVVLEATVPR